MKPKIKLTDAEENLWVQFARKMNNLDALDRKSFGWHWFWGIYFLHKQSPDFPKFYPAWMGDTLPDGHWLKEIDGKIFIEDIGPNVNKVPSNHTLKEIYYTISQRDVFALLLLEEHKKTLLRVKETGIIDLSNLCFNQRIDFGNCIFPFDVSFAGSESPSRTDFCETIFYKEVDFTNTKFASDTRFRKTIFCSGVKFDKAEFTNSAVFNKTQFLNYVTFKDVNFFNSAYFDEVKFSKDVVFENTEFSEAAGFTGAIFSGAADFKNVVFCGETAKFAEANFKKAKFFESAIFTNATFHKKIKFDWVTFEGHTDFINTEFKQYVPSSHKAEFHSNTSWSWEVDLWPQVENHINYKTDEDYKIRIKDNQNAYENLSSQMKKLDKYHDEHFFYRQEMCCRRWRSSRTVKFFYYLYEKLADYGYGIKRALYWWLGHIALGSSLLFIHRFFSPIGKWYDDLSCSVGISFANAHGFLSFHNKALEKCNLYLDELYWFNTIWLFQTIFGILFLFLLLLTVRIRFRLK